jgi:hypothetical protein
VKLKERCCDLGALIPLGVAILVGWARLSPRFTDIGKRQRLEQAIKAMAREGGEEGAGE